MSIYPECNAWRHFFCVSRIDIASHFWLQKPEVSAERYEQLDLKGFTLLLLYAQITAFL